MADAYPALYARTAAARAALPPGAAVLELETALTSREAARATAAIPLAPDDPVRQESETGQRALLRALRDRLERLGYLNRTQAKALDRTPLKTWLDTAELRGAIRLFQREAGIVEDAWLGPQTWSQLQALYSFEGARSALGRQVEPATGPLRDAERRAALWRLDALGLVADEIGAAPLDALDGQRLGFRLLKRSGQRWEVRPVRGHADAARVHLDRLLVRPLQRLRRALADLGLAAQTAQDDAALARLVIRHDALLEALAGMDPDRGATLVSGSAGEALAGRVLIIEMWLLDQDVPMEARRDWRSDADQRTAVSAAIRSVLETLADTADETERGSVAMLGDDRFALMAMSAEPVTHFPQLLAAVQAIIARARDDAAVNEALVDAALERAQADEGEALETALEAETDKRRSRLFDGIRRAIGWLARLVRRIVGTIVELARRIVRVVFAFTGEAINAVRDACLVVTTGIELFLSPQLRAPAGALHLVRGFGFDFCALAAPGPGLADDAQFIRLASQALQRASALIGELIAAVRKIARVMAGGWVLVGLGLLKISRKARAYARWLGEVRELAEAIRELTVSRTPALPD